jgi:hypothetical protein
MRKMIEAIERWWNGITPRRQTALVISYEISVCLLLCGNGAIMAIDLIRGLWLGWMNAAVTLLLCVVLIVRNYWWRRLLVAQKEQVKNLEKENWQLKEVALAAAAVQIMVEHGLPLNLDPLNRSLNAFQKKMDLSKMN